MTMTIFTRLIGAALWSAAIIGPAQAATVFDGGTIFASSSIITSASPTAFLSTTYGGIDSRYMFDRRVNDWVYKPVYIFNTSFADGLASEVNVNMEFGSVAAALNEASHYSTIIGQLPTVLRNRVKSIWINDGVQPFGGGNDSLLIHTGQGALYERDGIIEETFVHEATHTSLDPALAQSAGWLAAQKADPKYISPYAEQFPDREDLAESFLMWMAVRFRPDSLSAERRAAIESGIPNRLTFLDRQNFDLGAFGSTAAVPEPGTWMMMIAGFAMIGGALRHRRATTLAPRAS